MAQKIAGLTQNIEELKSEKALLLNQFNCADDHGIEEIKQHIASMDSSLKTLNQQEKKYTAELDMALTQYTGLQQQAADMDAIELEVARQTIRSDKEYETSQHLQTTYGKKFGYGTLAQSRRDVAKMLDEPEEPTSINQVLKQHHKQRDKQSRRKARGQER